MYLGPWPNVQQSHGFLLFDSSLIDFKMCSSGRTNWWRETYGSDNSVYDRLFSWMPSSVMRKLDAPRFRSSWCKVSALAMKPCRHLGACLRDCYAILGGLYSANNLKSRCNDGQDTMILQRTVTVVCDLSLCMYPLTSFKLLRCFWTFFEFGGIVLVSGGSPSRKSQCDYLAYNN